MGAVAPKIDKYVMTPTGPIFTNQQSINFRGHVLLSNSIHVGRKIKVEKLGKVSFIPISEIWPSLSRFLSAPAKLQNATISFVMPVRPSVRRKQLGSHWTDFNEI
jgi:hypothetical protein